MVKEFSPDPAPQSRWHVPPRSRNGSEGQAARTSGASRQSPPAVGDRSVSRPVSRKTKGVTRQQGPRGADVPDIAAAHVGRRSSPSHMMPFICGNGPAGQQRRNTREMNIPDRGELEIREGFLPTSSAPISQRAKVGWGISSRLRRPLKGKPQPSVKHLNHQI